MKKVNLKDPMVIILVALLVFLTVGSFIGGMMPTKVIIELDAAYGGDETGYQGIINEADFTEEVVDRLATLLKKDSHFEVRLTNDSNTTMSIAERCEKINMDQADIVLSIHASGTPDTTKSGMCVYSEVPSSLMHDASLSFAQNIVTAFSEGEYTASSNYLYYQPCEDDSYEIQVVSSDDLTDYGYETLEMMESCDVPVVIVNQIYVSNQKDIDTWANESGYTKSAELYYQAIRSYYGYE